MGKKFLKRILKESFYHQKTFRSRNGYLTLEGWYVS